MYDIAVIGGGPAGLSAAIQARARNKSVLVVSGDDRDNPLYKTSRIDNYLGFYNVTGPELLERFRTHAGQMGVERRDGRVLNLLAVGGAYYLSIGSEVEQARAVVLATGVVRAKKYPGEAERLGAGVSYCATCDGMLYRGREIAVVGKTADAPHEANYLRELGCRVTYVSDRPPEGLHSDIPFVKAVRLEVLGEKKVEALRADSVTLPCEGVFILRPSMAPADLLPGLALEGGYIKTDRNMATNLPGVFAAGDCTGLPLQVSKAVGEGCIALAGVEQTGHRQKAVYRITEAGRSHLHTLIADALRASSALYPTTLYSALSLADKLPPAEVRLALEEQRRRLEAEYAALERGRAGNEGQEVPPLARITIDNMVDIVQRQRRCVEELLAAVGEAP